MIKVGTIDELKDLLSDTKIDSKSMKLSDQLYLFRNKHKLELTKDEIKEMDRYEFEMFMMNYDSDNLQESPLGTCLYAYPMYIMSIFDAN